MIERSAPTWDCYLAIIPPAILAVDMVWEHTVLSWNEGLQMIGFRLAHTVGILLIPALLASMIWAVVKLVAPIFEKRKWRLWNLVGAFAIVVLLGIAWLPYGFWIATFPSRYAEAPHASYFLVEMARRGELPAVRALLIKGVPVNAPDWQKQTAIQAAKKAKQQAVVDYLASEGAK